jgi:ABC-type antimicrobial peptide transport system ATPase subunit
MKLNRLEKTVLLAVTLAAVATGLCKGEIRDTRGLSARRYQMRGVANSDSIVTYARGNWNVIEQFNANGHCELIEYSHLDKSNLTDNEISMLLQNNSTTASNRTGEMIGFALFFTVPTCIWVPVGIHALIRRGQARKAQENLLLG